MQVNGRGIKDDEEGMILTGENQTTRGQNFHQSLCMLQISGRLIWDRRRPTRMRGWRQIA